LEDGDPEQGGSFEEIEEFLLQLWEEWVTLRRVMREDLGVRD
jgi:hypothetical protein